MFYKPHILQKKVIIDERDEYGRLALSTEQWVEVCACRCDDNTEAEMRTDNGNLFRPHFHVVCEGNANVKAGDECRCCGADGTIRGMGKCERVKRLNHLNYSELWM